MRNRLAKPLHVTGTWLLMVALAHQLGACPCGCIEHDLWVTAVKAAFCVDAPNGDAHSSDDSRPAEGDHQWRLAEEAHCHGELPEPYVTWRRWGSSSSALADGLVCGPPALLRLDVGPVPRFSRLRAASSEPRVSAVAPARAALQVFLI